MSNYLARTVMKQFSNSPTLLALLSDFDQWVDVDRFSAEFLAYVWDISTARGFGLDIWGRILGQSRFIQIAQTPGDNFGFNINTAVGALAVPATVGATTLQLIDRFGNPLTGGYTIDSIHRTDWQGRQLLYSTARTNAQKYSSDFSNANWQGFWVKPPSLAGGSVAPDGTATAFSFPTSDATGVGHFCGFFDQKADPYPDGVPATVSVFLRADVPCEVIIGFRTDTPGQKVCQVGTSWQRFAFSYTPTSTDFRRGMTISFDKASAANSALPAGTRVYLWGAQGEAGPTATSYLPTTTAPVTVTDYTNNGDGTVTLGRAVASGDTYDETLTYTQTGTQWQPWNQAPFYGGATSGTTSFPLQDDYFRQLLLVKAASNVASCDCPSINALMRAMFGNRGKCYVGYDALNPMNIGYHFEFFPTAVEKSIIESGLFPQPAGTTATYIYGALTYAPFGFAGANAGANPAFVTGFDQGPFYQP